MSTTLSFIPPEVVLGTTTSWLLVTTAYPSVPGCNQAFFLFPGQPIPVAWDPGYGYFAGATLTCLPPQATSWWEQGHQRPDGLTSLSIQPITCPEAFTTAATEIRSGSSTLVMCCPSGYDLNGGQPGRVTGACQSPISSGQIITYAAQDQNYAWVSSTLTFTTATSMDAIPMEGWNVATSTSSTTSIVPTSTSTFESNNTTQTSRGLSAGASAGVGIGVAVGVIALAALVFLMFRSRRKQRHHQQHHEPLATDSPVAPYEAKREPIHEVQNTQPHEMYNHPVELESRHGQTPKSRTSMRNT